MISAEITIIPIGTGKTSLSDYVAAAVAALDKNGVPYKVSGMGTIIESNDLEEVLEAVKVAHEAVFFKGTDRVATSIIIDDRRDVEKSIKEKVSSVREKLEK